jgi:hypothetical protein
VGKKLDWSRDQSPFRLGHHRLKLGTVERALPRFLLQGHIPLFGGICFRVSILCDVPTYVESSADPTLKPEGDLSAHNTIPWIAG